MKKVLVCFAVLLAVTVSAAAQETETKVVDEVVAQVNNDVITLSRVKHEMKEAVDSFVEQGKTREEAQRMVDEKQGELIANLINEQLLMQKAKDLGLEKEVEQSVNQRIAEIMKQNNIRTVEALYAEMEKQGVDPQDLKETWRKQATREMVLQREVQSKTYWNVSAKELRDYYERNKAKFTKPVTVSFSELFLGFAGRDEAQVRQKAKQIYDQLKAGADFDKLAKDNGDKGLVTQGQGKLENLPVSEINETVGNPLKGVRVKDYTLPIEIKDLGIAILRVDAREAASSESVFDENAVRMAMLNERAPEAQAAFMAKLREESYIKIGESYRPIVSPILFANERKAKAN